jgi:branched-chain amino acid transport system substrate-binding protein
VPFRGAPGELGRAQFPYCVVCVAVLLLAACGSSSGGGAASSAPGVTSNSILFGQTAPQSGPAAQYGQSTSGVEAYFAYVNGQGGVQGRKLQLTSLDDQYTPSVALQDTRQLITQDQVFAEVACNGTATSIANLQAQAPANVPVIGVQTGAKTFAGTFRPFLYNVWPAYLTEGKLLGSYAKDTLHLNKIGVLYQNDDFGKSLFAGVNQAGVQGAPAISYDPTQVNFGPQAEQFKSAGVDGVIILAIPQPTIAFLNAMVAINFHPTRLMSQVSAIPQSFSAAAGEFPGSYIGAFIPPLTDLSNPEVKTFTDAMQKYEAGKPISVFAGWGWQEAQVAVAGLRTVQGSLTRDSYEQALNQIKNLQTIGGTISYSATGHPGVTQMFMVQAGANAVARVSG